MKKTCQKLLILATVLVMVFSLVACDMLTSLIGGNQEETPKDSTQKNTSKIELADAVDNYESKDKKRTDLNISFNGTLFSQALDQTNKEYGLGTSLKATRIRNGDKHYFNAELLNAELQPNGVYSSTVSMLNAVIATLKRPSSQSKELEDLAKVATPYLEYFSDFLAGKVNLDMQMGEQNNTYNIKAEISDSRTAEDSSLWYVANEASLRTWLNSKDIESTSTGKEMRNFLMRSVYTSLRKSSQYFKEDSASQFINKDGKSEYEITLQSEHFIADSAIDMFLSGIGVTVKQKDLDTYKSYVKTVEKWISLESGKINGVIAKDNLPEKIDTKIVVTVNIDIEELKTLLTTMSKDDVISEDQLKKTNAVINILSNFLRGVNYDENHIGIKLSADIEENFSYTDAKCNLGQYDSDLFIAYDQTPAGRKDIKYSLTDIIENVDSYILRIINNLPEEYKDEANDIKQKLEKAVADRKTSGQAEITRSQMETILENILLSYVIGENDKETKPDSDTTVAKEKAKELAEEIWKALGDK